MKILIVEDNTANRLLVTHYVERLGAEAYGAADGASAVAMFREHKPDIVLLDVILPDFDGYQVAQQLRASETNDDWTPIIFLSAMAEDEDLERGIAAGGDDYLIKPVSEVVLGAKIRAMRRILDMRASLLVLTRELDRANAELRRLSSIDGLTGIANRRQFDETLDREWRRARRHASTLSLILCDVDHFKRYNDLYGHQRGDECLRRVAGCLQGNVKRSSDLAARYGGEEFAIILPETTPGGALFIAERVRHAVRELAILHEDSPLARVTLSLGVASIVPDAEQTPAELIARADQALYGAKHAGRDRVGRAEATAVPA